MHFRKEAIMAGEKNIIYVGGFELPDKNAAAHRVLANAKCLRDIGYEVILIGVSKEKTVSKEKFDVQGFKSYNIKYPETNREWIVYLTSITAYKNIINKEQPDFIIAYDFPAIPLYHLMKLPKIKTIADCTEWYQIKGYLLFNVLKWLDVSLRMRYLQSKLYGIIVISDYLEKYYLGKGVKNIINIPPLVDLNDNKWKVDLITNIEKDKNTTFIYSGSPGNGNKDRLDIVIESLKQFYISGRSQITLNVVGITKEYYIEHFNKNILLNSEYDFVSFKGRISHNLSISSLKEADFSIFFRYNNLTNTAGFPTKFVESISSGTPVITNVSSNIDKYFLEGGNEIGIIIRDLHPLTISHAFNEVLSMNRDELNLYKRNCSSVQIFDYRNYYNQFLKLLK